MMLMVAIILFESVRKWFGPAAPRTVGAGTPVEAD
jgi:hypothetical protein